ncbi:hypothetical protein KAW80_00045 [Candidatus Babeliales bacterium]|nr:hypothetical protein [Candidatus Babeliales bacterium]
MKKFLLVLLLISSIKADIIDGDDDPVGNPRNLSINPIYIGFDHSQTTSIKNHTLTNLSGSETLITFTTSSHLVLENTTLSLDGTFTFSHGAIEIVGNVNIEGSDQEFYLRSIFIRIRSGSKLRIGNGITFVYTPTSYIKSGIQFEDSSGVLELDNATLKVDNQYGLQIGMGNIEIKGNSTIDNASTDTTQALVLGFGTHSLADCKLKINSGAELTIKNAGAIWRNKGTGSLDSSDGEGSLVIEKTGNFIVEETLDTNQTNLNINSSKLTSKIGTGAVDSVSDTQSEYVDGTQHNCCEWRPQSDFLVVHGVLIYNDDLTVAVPSLGIGSREATWDPYGRYITSVDGANAHVVHFIEGHRQAFLMGSQPTGTDSNPTKFSPDGRFVLTVANDGSDQIKIYKFLPEESTVLEEVDSIYDKAWGLSWSPNGMFFSAYNEVADTFKIYKFDGQNIKLVQDLTVNLAQSAVGVGRSWSPDGVHVAFIDYPGIGTTRSLYIYRFDGGTATALAPLEIENYSPSNSWSPDGRAFLLFDTSGRIGIYLFDGSNAAPLEYGGISGMTDIGEQIRYATWSPDETQITISRLSDATPGVYELFNNPVVYSTTEAKTEITNSKLNLNKDLKLSNIKLEVG